MRYRLQRHDGTDCSATMVPITVLRMVPIQRYRHSLLGNMLLEALNIHLSISISYGNTTNTKKALGYMAGRA